MLRTAYLAVVLLLGTLAPARAEDVRLPGSKLILRDTSDAQQLVLVARQGVLAPLPGSTEDPTLVGGELEISNPGTGERARLTTSARDWSANALGTVFRFQNSVETGPGSEVRTIVVKHKRGLKISTRALGITLDEEAQGALSVVLRTGTRRHCFLFGGKIGKDKPGRFVAHKAPAPSACPGPIVGASTTTTSRPPGTRPTTTSVTNTSTSTSSSQPSTPTTSTTTATVRPTTTSSTLPPTTTTSTLRPTTTTSTPDPTTTSSTLRPTTTSSTLRPTTTSSTLRPTTTTSTLRPTTTSTSSPPPTTTSTSQPPPTTSSTSLPPTTSSTTSVPTTSTTTTTARPCGFRGKSCKGTCPPGLRCAELLDLCTCVP